MDQIPRSDDGFASNRNMLADSHQFNAYENLFPGLDQNFSDASWGVNASTNYPAQSRAQQPVPNWPQNANHLSAPSPHANINGQASPYPRSLSHSPAPYTQAALNGYAGAQNFQYQQHQYDPALIAPNNLNQNFNYPSADYQFPNSGTIAPQALEHGTQRPTYNHNPYGAPNFAPNNFGSGNLNRPFANETVDQAALAAKIPKGNNAGYFSIIDFDPLADATKSERMGSFLNIGKEALNWDVNRAALPVYVPRKSRKDLRKSGSNDPKLLAKLHKKSAKQKILNAAPKSLATSSSIPKTDPNADKIKYEGGSSSEEESSSSEDEGSSYTSDDEPETPPLPAKRPDNLKEATEYDTVKALWRSKRKTVDSESIRKALVAFWDIVKTIRDRWKADQAALTEAETKNRENELPLLKSRVKDQRDMLEAAFKAALKNGHRSIVELLSENVSLIFLCYQFLLDRSKVEDYNGSLSRVILEIMALFTTVTEDKLEKTHLVKVLPRFIKKGDAKTQFYAKRIIANAANASKQKSTEPTPKPAAKQTSAASPTTKRAEPEQVAGIKRSASTASDGAAQKKVATTASKLNGTSSITKQATSTKKTTPSGESSKPTATSTTVKPKQVVAKPSGLFASLQSAAKKPGTSNASKTSQTGTALAGSKSTQKNTNASPSAEPAPAPKSTFSLAETMANLSKPNVEKSAAKEEKQAPIETPAEKAKRLRKESRRHLRVSFKPQDELTEVHVFDHDPEEEQGHDANQVRDVADVGGEGRMFKQLHQQMDVDDEDEAAEEEQKLVEFKQPDPIDFTPVPPDERQRNYARFGGGEVEPKSEERSAMEHHEANTLIVFYNDTNDIPANPKEPSDPYNGETTTTVTRFGAPDNAWAVRARQKKSGQAQTFRAHQQSTVQSTPATQTNPAAPFDISKFMQSISKPPEPANNQQAPPAPLSQNALSSLLASINQPASNQTQPVPPPAMLGYGNQFPPAPPNMNLAPTQPPLAQPNGQPDIAAILAQIAQNPPAAAQAPPMGGYGYGTPNMTSNVNSYQPPMQQSGVYENPERKRWREGGDDGGQRNKKQFPTQSPAQNPYYRTKVCKYWQEGRCQKGDQCSYKHEEA